MKSIRMLNAVRNLAGYLNHPATTFSLGAVFIMFVDIYITKGIDSSFVSAVMDTVMAGVAVLAIIKAKQIWDEKGKDIGHKYAMKLLTEVVPTMNVSSSTLYHLHMIESYLNGINRVYDESFNSLHEEIDNKRRYIKETLSVVDKVKSESIFEMNKINDACDNLIAQINMCGISIRDNDAGDMLRIQVYTYREFTKKLIEIYLEVTKTFYFINVDSVCGKKEGDYVSLDNFMAYVVQGKLDIAIDIFEKTKELGKELKANINKMKSSKNNFSNYFEL